VQLTLLAVGRLRPFYREAADVYLRRLGRYAEVAEREVKETSDAGSSAVARRREAGLLRERLPPRAFTVALAREGRSWTSRELSRQLERWRSSTRHIALVLGGSHGLDPGLIRDADAVWSLGPLTLPHELARVVVLEQVYRAFTIFLGDPYHKGG
jgi:23S rRNA (pseudouridine1915-N3)-methyltransferase